MSVWFLCCAVLAATQLAWMTATLAQPVPHGPEFQVNTYATGNQYIPAVAIDGLGNFIVAWQSSGGAGSDTHFESIQAQRYDPGGTPLSGQFQVNTYTTELQRYPAVAADAFGNFVVVWVSLGSASADTDFLSVQAQRYDDTGTPLGGEFQVNTYTTSAQFRPSVAVDGAGNFVVVWESGGSAESDTSSDSIQAQRYDDLGNPVGGQFQVNTYITGNQIDPMVAHTAGNFVVTWASGGSAGSDASSYSIQAQRYDSLGSPIGGEFQVNTYTTGSQRRPVLTADVSGNFTVAWHSDGSQGSDASSYSIQAQRYDNTGTPFAGQFQVNSVDFDAQTSPALATDGAGGFVVVWETYGSDGSQSGIAGQRYDAAANPQGGQFQVNTYTSDNQVSPAVAAKSDGGFLVVWTNHVPEGDQDVHGQWFVATSTSSSSSSTTSTSSSTTSSSTTSTLPPVEHPIPGRMAIIRPGALAKFVAKPVTGDTFALPAANPIADGGALRIFDVATTAGDNAYGLPSGASWKGLGNPAGSKGYKYAGAGTPTDPCKVVLVKEKVIKGVCKGTGITLTPSFAGDVGIILSLGTTDRYCAQFGGDESRNDATLTKRKNAPAPTACP